MSSIESGNFFPTVSGRIRVRSPDRNIKAPKNVNGIIFPMLPGTRSA